MTIEWARRIVASFAVVIVTVFSHTSEPSGRTDWDCSHSSETNRSSPFNAAAAESASGRCAAVGAPRPHSA